MVLARPESQKSSWEYWLLVVQAGGTMQGGGGCSAWETARENCAGGVLNLLYKTAKYTNSIQFSMALYRETGAFQNQIVILSNAIKHCTYLATKLLCNND